VLVVLVSMLLVSVLLELVYDARFLDLTRYYRKFFKGYASTVTSLTKMLKKDRFYRNSSATTTFEALKLALTEE
jgi:hypothetical protein